MKFNIVEVKLSYLLNDSQLTDIFHNKEYICNEICTPVPINNRIYIFEDIDAESSVIEKRKSKVTEDKDEKDDKKSTFTYMKKKYNKGVTLSGLLNTLDGILEIKGIIIITTNYVEKLDEVLIRPGRITMNVKLDNINQKYAAKMVKSYFPDKQFILNKAITPATLKSYCEISKNIEELYKHIN